MFEYELVRYCSPTLTGIKTANLFNTALDFKYLCENIKKYNELLKPAGIKITIIKRKGKNTLLYVYRTHMLKRDLKKSGVEPFLRKYGYNTECISKTILNLRKRMAAGDEFPHEIGLFLGYPFEDVVSFIKNKGCNFKCSGCWKVYHNEKKAQKIFCIYKECTNVCCRFFDLYSQNAFGVIKKIAAV